MLTDHRQCELCYFVCLPLPLIRIWSKKQSRFTQRPWSTSIEELIQDRVYVSPGKNATSYIKHIRRLEKCPAYGQWRALGLMTTDLSDTPGHLPDDHCPSLTTGSTSPWRHLIHFIPEELKQYAVGGAINHFRIERKSRSSSQKNYKSSNLKTSNRQEANILNNTEKIRSIYYIIW